jgi:4-hydroxythreonine-4-phosphate dehydrogenase
MTVGSHSVKPVIAISMGDPCGVGPEIIAKALTTGGPPWDFLPLVVGDVLALRRACHVVGTDFNFTPVETVEECVLVGRSIPLVARSALTAEDLVYGAPTERACRAAIDYIETAARLAMECSVQAVCTCPIHKANLQRSGFAFPGHTEFLRHLTAARQVVMMLAGPRLKVSLATIHVPLAKVPQLLNRRILSEVIQITGEALVHDFAIESPHLAVAGLNPHAGEDGQFGGEEKTVIQPVIESFAQARFRVSGPYSADTVFYRAQRGEFDAVVAMYHDQGLIPIKLIHFNDAVNLTLGMPIIRTSVDHGTAYDIAGSGQADAGSLRSALQLAGALARNRFYRHASATSAWPH